MGSVALSSVRERERERGRELGGLIPLKGSQWIFDLP